MVIGRAISNDILLLLLFYHIKMTTRVDSLLIPFVVFFWLHNLFCPYNHYWLDFTPSSILQYQHNPVNLLVFGKDLIISNFITHKNVEVRNSRKHGLADACIHWARISQEDRSPRSQVARSRHWKPCFNRIKSYNRISKCTIMK